MEVPDPDDKRPGGEGWHSLPAEDVLQRLGSTREGLTPDDAEARLKRDGPNIVPRGRREGPLALLWRQINNPLIWVLIVSGAVSMLVDPTGGLKNGLVIMGVVVLNSLIGFVQEFTAGRSIDELTKMVPETATLLRAGKRTVVARETLVQGDVVVLSGGEQIPADLRIISSRNLQVEEAALTGESVPTSKRPDTLPTNAALGDRTSMVYAGTLVSAGAGVGVVVETGARTELGRISSMLRETTDLATPLTRALASIGRVITVAIVALSLVIVAVGAWRTVVETGVPLIMAIRETVIFGIALAVGAIPEGLPAIVTIALAIGVRRMATRRAVVRHLPAVETLGSTTVICSDKTGTLTRNEMTVQRLWTPISREWRVTGVGFDPVGHLERDGRPTDPDPSMRELLLAGALCNDSGLALEEGRWKVQGDPTEAALLVAAKKGGLALEELRTTEPRLDAIPFESENQYMATLHGGGGGRVFMKGSPEAVLARCTEVEGAHLSAGLVMATAETFAEEGLRVLAFAVKVHPDQVQIQTADIEDGFRFVGLQAMIDPPRPEAILAVDACRTAGITVKMITGDHRGTARAVGRALGLVTEDSRRHALEGKDIDDLSDRALEDAVQECAVFARVAPEHKLRLVRALQRRGEVLAMTGDGVNDAPALKQANIGVAMGITGTSASRSVADLVLTDDNFATIAAAVEEGRQVYDNLVKSLAFVLPTNLALALILAWAVAFFPFTEVMQADGTMATALLLPMSPTQLLWINLVAAVALALPLAFEATEPDIMRRPPRDPSEPVLNPVVVSRTALVSILITAGAVALFNYELEAHEVGLEEGIANAQTIAVTTVVAFQIFYLFSCRSLRRPLRTLGFFSNPMVFWGVGATLGLQAFFIYSPVMNGIFGSSPLPAWDLIGSLLVGTLIIPTIEVERLIRIRLAKVPEKVGAAEGGIGSGRRL